ncbi:ABC transporter permease [Acidaminobacter sp. JC074]|uniref:ABC transporter permease n=1 Tax=Acidaminobacter sp. JC074 TaxID=2530199 RepID=UPI001F0E4790|nr:ABC transporter permease [Acidaminobacter sp. JC074]MCH4886349.1 ABC transporter permease [Acidaminobacter sp. JC074]
MRDFVIRRFISMIITLFVIATVTFFLMHAIPGDPFSLPRETPQEIRDNLEEKYGLNKPILEQYFIYLKNILKGDFGISMKYKGTSVVDKVTSGIPKSAVIGFGGIFVGCTIGILLGIVAALNRGKGFDYLIIILAILGVSIPSFVMASLLQYAFAVKIPLFKVAGWGGLEYMILPIFSAAMMNIAFYARILRSSMLDVLNQDYIYTARSKGLYKNEVIRKHVLRNSLLPLVTSLGPMCAGAITGNFVIEKIFNVPGIGQSLIIAIQNSDYTMIMGLTIIFAFITIVMYFLVDIIYGLVDPRIRLAK